MVDAFVSVFLEKLINALTEQSHYVSEFQGQFERLKTELLLMRSFLKDAVRLKRKSETLREIIACLRDCIYEAEDILADCQVWSEDDDRGLISKCSVCFYPGKLSFHYKTGKRLQDINEKIVNIKQSISCYLGVPISDQTDAMDTQNDLMLRWSSPVYDHDQVVGLERETEEIKGWLFEASDGILEIGIVGMGGLGKTTIAQKVFNDRGVEDWFERKIWVSVSQTFTEERIMRSILRTFNDACVGDDQSQLLKKINQYLFGNRYLIVMDDVWSLDNAWWLRIFEGLPKGNGSCIMITTRNEKVAQKMGVRQDRMHQPKFLNEGDSWLLFRRIAFAASGGKCVHSDVEKIGKEIVKKCKGLPLAIKAIGGVMLCKPPYYPEWRRIFNCFREELAESDDSVMASLQLSYDELPPYLKSCFLCLSLYPEDCVISKEQLIHWWIGEGFVPLRNGRLSTEVGEDCFSELKNRCLIEAVNRSYNGVIYTCKIHDMVRDLAIKIAEDDAFFVPSDGNCRHLYIRTDMNPEQLNTKRKFRALLTTTRSGEVNKIASDVAKKFCKCHRLQVLDLSKSIFKVPLAYLLNEIGSLQHLTCLSLSNTHPLIQLPHSFEALQHLQILDVSHCQNLRLLPSCVTTFKKLTVLNVSQCGSLQYLPKGIGRLVNLQVLLGFRPAKSNLSESGCRIAELKSLTRLRKLGLWLTHGNEIGDDEVNALVQLHELQLLTISCFASQDSDLVSKLEKLSPPEQLHELCLNFYPGKVSPFWLNPLTLPMLRYLSICSGELTTMNESFLGDKNVVWKIEGLKLEALSDLSEEWHKVHQAMPFLRLLNVSWCPGLDSFPIEDAGFRGGVWKMAEGSS